FGSRLLSARGANGLVRDVSVRSANVRLDEVAAVVDLADDAVSLARAVEVDRRARPRGRRTHQRLVIEDVAVTIRAEARCDDAGLGRRRRRADGGVDGNYDANEVGDVFDADSQLVDLGALPE